MMGELGSPGEVETLGIGNATTALRYSLAPCSLLLFYCFFLIYTPLSVAPIPKQSKVS